MAKKTTSKKAPVRKKTAGKPVTGKAPAKKTATATAPAKKAAAKRISPASPKGARSASTIFKHYTSGASLEELKKKFGIRGKSQVASAVLDTLIKAGKLPALRKASGKGKGTGGASKVKVNKRGTVILPKDAVVGTFGFKEGQAFSLRKQGKKIILTREG